MNTETKNFIEEIKKQYGRVEFVTKGSSLKLCMVAEGLADLYPRLGPTMEWDTAAGHAIAKFAGCSVTVYGKDIPLEYNKENLLNPWFIVKSGQQNDFFVSFEQNVNWSEFDYKSNPD